MYNRKYKTSVLVLTIITCILLIGTSILITFINMNTGEYLIASFLLYSLLIMSMYLLALIIDDAEHLHLIELCSQHRYVYDGYYISDKEFVNKIYFRFRCLKCGKYLELSEDNIIGDLIMITDNLAYKKSLGETRDEGVKESTIAIPRYCNVPAVFTGKEVTLLLTYYEHLGISKKQFMNISMGEYHEALD